MTAELVTTASRSPRQEQLVVEGARLFASRGYAAVSMQQLATRAVARHLERVSGEAGTSADHAAHLLHTFLAAPAAG